MFGSFSGIGLGKREERGLVRTTILRRWGIPIQTPRNSPVNAQNPGHDGGAGLQPGACTCTRYRTNDRAMLRRCSLFDISGGSIPSGASACVEGSSTPLYCDYALLVAKLVSFLSLKGREVPTESSRFSHPLSP